MNRKQPPCAPILVVDPTVPLFVGHREAPIPVSPRGTIRGFGVRDNRANPPHVTRRALAPDVMEVPPEETPQQRARRLTKTKIPYDQDIAEYILQEMCKGRTLVSICNEPLMPSCGTVCNWARHDHNGFREQYEQAQQLRAEVLAEQILDIADDESDDHTEDGKIKQRSIDRARLRIDTRKWHLSKMVPKKFGEAQLLKLADPEGESLPILNLTVVPIAPLARLTYGNDHLPDDPPDDPGIIEGKAEKEL